MKKILVLLGALAIVASSSATLISCGLPARWMEEDIQHNNIDDLSLNVDFDNEKENNYDYIETQVDQLINELNPLAKNGKDYVISKEGFNLDNKVISPRLVQVSATDDSKYLTGSFNVRVYKDFDRQIEAAKLPTNGTFDQGKAAKKAIQEMLEAAGVSDQVNNYYEFVVDPNNPGSWTVRSIGTDSIVKINFSFEQTIFAFNLNTLNGKIADFPVSSKTDADLHKEIATLITSQRTDLANVQEGVDYQVTGSPDLGETQILVESKGKNQYLTGSFTIEVLKESFDGFDFKYGKEVSVLNNKNELDLLIQDNFKEQFKNFNLVLNTDYEINFQADNWVEVSARENSAYVTGSFKFQLNKFSLTQINDLTWNDLAPNSTVDEIRTRVIEIINNKLVVDGVQRKEISEADLEPVNFDHPEKLTFNASSDSLIIEGSLTIFITGIDLADLPINLAPKIVGQQSYESLKTEVVNNINHALPKWVSEITVNDLAFDSGTTKEMKAAGTITIKPSQAAKQLTGMLSINVNKKDITPSADVKPVYFPLAEASTIKQQMVDQINQILANDQVITLPIKASVDDFEILDQKNQPVDTNWVAGNYTLKAKDSSPIISGEIKLIVDKYNMTKDKVDPVTVGAVDSQIDSLVQELKDKFPLIQEGVDYDIINPSDGFKPGTVTIQSMKDSAYLTGSISFEVKALDLLDLKSMLPPAESKPGEDPKLYYEVTRLDIENFKTLFDNKVNQLFADKHSTIKAAFGNDYDLFDANGNKVIDNEHAPYIPKGHYFVKPINNGLDYFENTFEFEITPTNLNFGKKIKDFTVGKDSVEYIKNYIHDWVNQTAGFPGTDTFKEGIDYLIQNDKGNVTKLERSGQKWVRLFWDNKKNKYIDHPYITGGKYFNVVNYNLKDDGVKFTDDDWKGITGKSTEAEIISAIEKALNRVVGLNDLIKYNDKEGFTLNSFDEWMTKGITITSIKNGDKFTDADGNVTISENDSPYISGNFTFKLPLNPVSLKDINVELQEQLKADGLKELTVNDDYQIAEANIEKAMNKIFKNSITKPVLTTEALKADGKKGDYYITGPATQLVDHQLTISGPDALIIKPEPTSKFFVDQAGVEVQDLKMEVAGKGPAVSLYETTGGNYLLTSTSSEYYTDSTYGQNKAQLDGTNPGVNSAYSPINKNEILAVSRFFLVTTRGIFLGPKLIPETKPTDSFQLNYEDIISVTDSFVLTTKGSWYYSSVNNTPSTNWKSAKFSDPIFDHLTHETVKVPTENLIVTTNGIYWGVRPNLKEITEFIPLPVVSKELPTFDFNDYLAGNNSFIVTKQGVFANPEPTSTSMKNTPWFKVDVSIKDTTDILEFSLSNVAIKNFGIVSIKVDGNNTSPNIVKLPNLSKDVTVDGQQIVDQSNNYLVTNNKIYWQGSQIDIDDPVTLTSDDIIAITDHFLVTKNRIYFESTRVGKGPENNRKNTFNFVKDDLLYVNDRFLVMKQGIHYEYSPNDYFGAFSLTTTSPNTTVAASDLFHENNNVVGITGTYVATKKGTWYREPGSTHGIQNMINRNIGWRRDFPILTDETFIMANDYYLITRTISVVVNNKSTDIMRFGKNGKDNLGRPTIDYGLFNNLTKDDILGLKGEILLFKEKGIYFYNDPYYNSEGPDYEHKDSWEKSDILRIGNQGQILTKYKTWKRWNALPDYIYLYRS